MMKILHNAQAGSLESSDALITISPAEKGAGVLLDLNSIVQEQFGEQIRSIVQEVLARKGIEDVRISIQDRGALDYSLRARVETALSRASTEV